ncbi:hypothetical protein JKP88DRAFT_334891 [Tribonema minus]|uniref:Uncharacterized protein n=1 Tax=Tribonema minus TaxID=303371 RepID=A0A836C9U3_9STRA|nr:hypothetical protein JKP88DRAFT_334891 [Tribonema minus]
MFKLQALLLVLFLAGVSAFVGIAAPRSLTVLRAEGEKLEGMTRNPDPIEHEDPRKSIKAAPTFEEYLKQRQGAGQK